MNCEIEFLPVGDASRPGDAIVVRYGDASSYELMIVDGGNLDSGKALVTHVRNHFGNHAVISHVVLTHADADHASGLRVVLSELPVVNLWMHVPWAFAAAARPYFANKNCTVDGLQEAIRKEYDVLIELVQLTAGGRQITLQSPFAGATIGPFRVLSPHRDVFTVLLPQFDRTPDPDQKAIEATGWWIGKQPGVIARMLDRAKAKAQTWVTESWGKELLRDGGITSASNESSVVLYGDFGVGRRVLLTGDTGVRGLSYAAYCAGQLNLPLQDFMFVQIPHHGSRRNVGPTILNQILGPIQAESSATRFYAFVSAPKDDDTHPRKMVLNAFTRRGGAVIATQGTSKVHWGGFPARDDYETAAVLPFAPRVEQYDS
jgi:beta-lactamase superfamily II metal-dependent hydrolase